MLLLEREDLARQRPITEDVRDPTRKIVAPPMLLHTSGGQLPRAAESSTSVRGAGPVGTPLRVKTKASFAGTGMFEYL
jgi:hypothetical protein